MKSPFRKRVHACIHPETYKYFLPPQDVPDAWARCGIALGEVRDHPTLPMIELDAERLLLRAPSQGNPITVVRKRGCTAADVARLHQLLGYREVPCRD